MPMHKSKRVAWLSQKAAELMICEAEKAAPNESGGVLIGYWVSSSELVITEAIGPGPDAYHTPYSFVPNAEYQETKIAELYESSGRLHTYLGDWHNHTDYTTHLSWKDKRTLVRIAKTDSARAPMPIMAIFAKRQYWKVSIWLLQSWQFFGQKIIWKSQSLGIKLF